MSAPDPDVTRRAWLQAIQVWDRTLTRADRWDLRLPADRPPPLTPEERRAWLERIDPERTISRRHFIPRRCEVTIVDDLDCYEDDAHTVRFSEMSAEAEAEMAAWDEMLHGRKAP